MTHPNDNMDFDRLVDGELSPPERQQLLASLDSQPDGWRQCALAFLESQAWRAEFKSLVAQELPPPVEQVSLPDVKTAASTPAPRRPFFQSAAGRWLENSLPLAATALLAFGIGWRMNPIEERDLPRHEVAANDVPAAPQPGPARDAPSRDIVTLVVQDEKGKPQRLRLPLVDAAELGDQWVGLSPQVPGDLRAGLRNRGFDLKSKQRFAPLFFEQNKQLVPMVVPVSDTYVVPVDPPVY